VSDVNKPLLGIFVFLLLALTTQFLRQVCQLMGMPDVLSLVREPLLLLLFLWGCLHLEYFQEKRVAVCSVGIVTVLCIYLLVAAFEGRMLEGAYYVRLYVMPLLFFIGCHVALQRCDEQQLQRVVRGQAWLNLVLVGAAFGLYALVQVEPRWRGILINDGKLATAWFIAGGMYMRMGLPFISPNNLGTYAALSALLSALILFAARVGSGTRRLQWLSLLFSLAALAASLSRSAMLLLIFAFLCFLTIPAFYQSRMFGRLIGYAFALAIFVILGLIVVEFISDGYFSHWVELNMAGKDPSLRGHIETFVEAWRDVDRYFLLGYPHGTVGPKAFQFTGHVHNAENSLLALIYDFGLPAAMTFVLLQLLLLSGVWHSRLQLPALVGFAINMQFLPIIFEPESIAFFLFVFLLLGHMARAGLFSHRQTDARAAARPAFEIDGRVPLRG